MIIHGLTNRLLCYTLVLAGLTLPGVSTGQGNSTQKTQEYFVQQNAGETLLVTINGFEAEFESVLTEQGGAILLRSALPGSRIAPVFQYVSAPEKLRQLNIQVLSRLHTNRSQFGLELTRLSAWDNRSKSVSRAYQLLSFGMQVASIDSKSNWTVKIDALINAGSIFKQFGMKEMRLWSDYLAAHLVQSHLHDHSMVYSLTREILNDLKGTRLQQIELATLQLHGQALIGLKRSGMLSIPADGSDPVQSILSRIVNLAGSMDYRFEQAHALNTSGAQYSADSEYAKALEQFQQAVVIADSVGDAELATGIRESIVQVQSQLGNITDSGAVLREIETQLAEEGAGDELALNLLAQGRLLIRSYHYDQAIEVLSDAMAYENNSAIRRQINFELARAYYASGRLDESMTRLQLAGVRAGPGNQRRINSLIDTGEGLRIMANIYRSKGAYQQMRETRRAQGLYTDADARYLYEQGLDERVIAGSRRDRARSFFQQSQRAAVASANVDLQHLARLQDCALSTYAEAADDPCSVNSVKPSYDGLLRSGVPEFATQAMYLWSQLLVINGLRADAIAVMDELLDEVHFLKHSLPGVLGAWYRQQREPLFEYYLDLLFRSPSQQGSPDDTPSLLALSKMRAIDQNADTYTLLNDETEQVLSLLATRAYAAPGQVPPGLNEKINLRLARIREPFKRQVEYLSISGINKYLQNLKPDEMVLTCYLSPTTAQVWIAQKGRVLRQEISDPADIYATLKTLRSGLADIGISAFERTMDSLGQRLVEPFAGLLTQTIYWIPCSPLLGIPFDSIRVNGEYLLERHTLVNLVSFPANVNPVTRLQTRPLQSVFLAGYPRDYSSDYADRLDTTSEIRALADLFVGPGLNIVQGVALLPDEFQEGHFRKSMLVHLSMPGSIDLKHPEQSGLELSGEEGSTVRSVLKPVDIRSQKLAARLVFLSDTEMINEPLSVFDSRPGLIGDFIDTGAQSVIASLWSTDGKAVEALIIDFYRRLEVSGNIAGSLRDARRQYQLNNRDNGLYDWAGYQLYIQ